MKKIDFLVVVLLLASCNSSNKHPETVVANPMPDTATVVRETTDTVQVDGMTSATAIACFIQWYTGHSSPKFSYRGT